MLEVVQSLPKKSRIHYLTDLFFNKHSLRRHEGFQNYISQKLIVSMQLIPAYNALKLRICLQAQLPWILHWSASNNIQYFFGPKRHNLEPLLTQTHLIFPISKKYFLVFCKSVKARLFCCIWLYKNIVKYIY